MQINLIECSSKEEEEEIIKLLKEKYKDNPNCKFSEISDTFTLPNKKWIIASSAIVKQICKRKSEERKIYSAEAIKNALQQNK